MGAVRGLAPDGDFLRLGASLAWGRDCPDRSEASRPDEDCAARLGRFSPGREFLPLGGALFPRAGIVSPRPVSDSGAPRLQIDLAVVLHPLTVAGYRRHDRRRIVALLEFHVHL